MNVHIETERLLLCRFSPEDWRDLMDYLSYKSVTRYSPLTALTEETAPGEAAERAASREIFAVEYRPEGKVIGELCLEPEEGDSWELSYFFHPRYQRQGLAREAVEALMDWAFTGPPAARRITASCDSRNDASRRFLQRLGFRQEGLLREHISFHRDEAGAPIWTDTCLYALLKREYRRTPPFGT